MYGVNSPSLCLLFFPCYQVCVFLSSADGGGVGVLGYFFELLNDCGG